MTEYHTKKSNHTEKFYKRWMKYSVNHKLLAIVIQ